MPSLGLFGQGSPAKLFIPVKNVQGAVLSANRCAAFPIPTSADGNQVVLVNSADTTFAPFWTGVAHADIANNGYGLVQVYGYRDSVLLSHQGTSITITKGDVLNLGALDGSVTSAVTPSYATSGFRFAAACETVTTSAAGYVKAFIRCL